MRSPGWPAALHDELMHWHREEAGGGARLRSGPHQLTALPPGDGQPDARWPTVAQDRSLEAIASIEPTCTQAA